MENVNPTFINTIITVLIPIFVPILVGILKKVIASVPKPLLPLIATGLGVIISVANSLNGGVPIGAEVIALGAGLGLAGTGVRELTKPVVSGS